MGIALDANKLVALDDFMTWYRKMSFAKLRLEIDLSEPLKLGVSIHRQEGIFWQRFIYENVPSIFYGCGQLENVVDKCELDHEKTRSREKS